MPRSHFDALLHLQQPFLTYEQPQHQPNQGPAVAEPEPDELDEDDDLDPLEEVLEEDPEEDPLPIPEPVVAVRADPLRAERQRNNHLEKEIRTLKRQLSQFSKINPDEYERLQDAERQKQQLEAEIATRERQLEAAAQRKVKAVAKERDEAQAEVLNLRKDRLLERVFHEAEGRVGGDNRGTFFEIFKAQVGTEFRLTQDANGRDRLEPIDSKGNALLGDDGAISPLDHVENLRTHPVLSFLFQQRGAIGPISTMVEVDGNGQMTNLQSMSTNELYLASFNKKPIGSRN